MTKPTSRKFFVNLPVRDLQRSIAFFTDLGFAFDPKFGGSCMTLGEDAHVMLLPESRFKEFSRKQLCDTRTHNEALFSISAGSRAEVDELVRKALAAGGTTADEPQDHGFMYDWSFHDLDGHGWGVMWMDPAQVRARSGIAHDRSRPAPAPWLTSRPLAGSRSASRSCRPVAWSAARAPVTSSLPSWLSRASTPSRSGPERCGSSRISAAAMARSSTLSASPPMS